MKKNIILLSAKRTGSTAVMKIFQKHKKVNLMHIDQKISNWESNFWLLALDAINGKKDSFNPTIYYDYNNIIPDDSSISIGNPSSKLSFFGCPKVFTP